MPDPVTTARRAPAGPPTKHQLAVMIWLAVIPTLTVLNIVLGDWLKQMTPVLRTFVLATVAVPIVIYALMPQLHRLRIRLLTRAEGRENLPDKTSSRGRRTAIVILGPVGSWWVSTPEPWTRVDRAVLRRDRLGGLIRVYSQAA